MVSVKVTLLLSPLSVAQYKTIRDLFLTLPIHHHVHLAARRQHRVTDLCQVQTDGDGQTDSVAGQIGHLRVFPGIQIRIQIPDISKQLFESASQTSVLLLQPQRNSLKHFIFFSSRFCRGLSLGKQMNERLAKYSYRNLLIIPRSHASVHTKIKE